MVNFKTFKLSKFVSIQVFRFWNKNVCFSSKSEDHHIIWIYSKCWQGGLGIPLSNNGWKTLVDERFSKRLVPERANLTRPRPQVSVTCIELAATHLALPQFVMLSIKYKDRTNTDIVRDCQLTTDILAVMSYNCVLGPGNQH